MGKNSGVLVDVLVRELRSYLIFLYFLSKIRRKVILNVKSQINFTGIRREEQVQSSNLGQWEGE